MVTERMFVDAMLAVVLTIGFAFVAITVVQHPPTYGGITGTLLLGFSAGVFWLSFYVNWKAARSP